MARLARDNEAVAAPPVRRPADEPSVFSLNEMANLKKKLICLMVTECKSQLCWLLLAVCY